MAVTLTNFQLPWHIQCHYSIVRTTIFREKKVVCVLHKQLLVLFKNVLEKTLPLPVCDAAIENALFFLKKKWQHIHIFNEGIDSIHFLEDSPVELIQ